MPAGTGRQEPVAGVVDNDRAWPRSGSRLEVARPRKSCTDRRPPVPSPTHALLTAETLDAPDAYAAAGVRMRPAELAPEPH